MRYKAKKITQFRDVQLTILIAIGHLKFRLDEAQQLRLADLAVVFAGAVLSELFRHVEGPQKEPIKCAPSRQIIVAQGMSK
jgi:hypothetical protein